MYPHSHGGPAELYFRYGAMNSGKTIDLMRTAYNYEERGMSVRIIKPIIDVKGEAAIVSRIGMSKSVDLVADADCNILNYLTSERKNDPLLSCALVDEAQFLEPIQVDQLLEATIILDIPVICYGLRSDFQTKAFPGSMRLLEVATVLEELRTICQCGNKGVYNARSIGGKFVNSGEQVAIDGQGEYTYESLCAACYLNQVGLPTPSLE